MRNFEVWQRPVSGGPRKRPGMTVTVSGHRTMAFSEEAWAALGSPEAVKFLVDKDPGERVIGFQACKRGEPNAHAVHSGTRTVSASALLKYLRYGTGTAYRYTLRVEDGLPPYIDLSEDAPVVTSNRRKT
jgi:hypothetical protein